MSVFVFACLSTVCLPASVSPELHTLSSPLFNTCYVTYSRGLVLLWRRFDTLCASGFVDDAIFAHNSAAYMATRKRSNSPGGSTGGGVCSLYD